MPKRAHHIAARQAQLAGRSKKKHQAAARPPEPSPPAVGGPAAPATGEAQTAGPVAPPAAQPAQPPSPPAVTKPSLTAVRPSQPEPKHTAAEARFFSDQKYFVHDLTRIGLITGAIAVAFVLLYFFLR